MNNDHISRQLDETFKKLMNEFDRFEPEQINLVPFAGSWTAGQLVQHLVMATSGMVDVLQGPVAEAERQPDELAQRIKDDFLNFNVKFTAAGFIRPDERDYDKTELLAALKKIDEGIVNAIETMDLEKICLAFELPVYGKLTRYEMLTLVIYHMQRHIHQLENIYKKLIK